MRVITFNETVVSASGVVIAPGDEPVTLTDALASDPEIMRALKDHRLVDADPEPVETTKTTTIAKKVS